MSTNALFSVLGLACGTELALSFLNAIVVGALHYVVDARCEFDRQGRLQGVDIKFAALKGPRNSIIIHIETREGLSNEPGTRDLLWEILDTW